MVKREEDKKNKEGTRQKILLQQEQYHAKETKKRSIAAYLLLLGASTSGVLGRCAGRGRARRYRSGGFGRSSRRGDGCGGSSF
jgi:hypothetical protein